MILKTTLLKVVLRLEEIQCRRENVGLFFKLTRYASMKALKHLEKIYNNKIFYEKVSPRVYCSVL
jgi:hypothetical protein